jgi:hypothetical protein
MIDQYWRREMRRTLAITLAVAWLLICVALVVLVTTWSLPFGPYVCGSVLVVSWLIGLYLFRLGVLVIKYKLLGYP